jgi:predicted metal-dependent hydrolase
MIDAFVLSKKDWIESAQRKISFLSRTPKAETAHDLVKQKILAKRLIVERIAHYNSDGRFRFKKVTVKAMSSRWGSCSYQGNLNFNYRLIYLEPELLDYVVVHELCHLIEHNHSARFWLEVKKIIPDYKIRERKIKKYLLC